MLRRHKRVSGGVKVYQKMKSSFFDCFYVMPPLTNGGHYSCVRAERVFRKLRFHIKISLGWGYGSSAGVPVTASRAPGADGLRHSISTL